jgi:hypothetical protein
MNRRRTLQLLSLGTALLTATASPAAAGSRADALGPAGFAAERGITAARLNPAHLALDAAPRWSATLVGMELTAGNSSFSLADYKRYNGTFLDESDKATILAAIDNSGMESFANGHGILPGVQIGPIALFALTRAAGSQHASRALFEAALLGVDLRNPLQLDADADATVWSEIGVAYGHAHGDLRFGAAAKLLVGHYREKGWSIGTLTPIFADSVLSSVATDGAAYTQTAEGGNGFGLDLGVAWERGATTLSLAAGNLFGRIRWDQAPHIEGSSHHSPDLVGEEFPEGEDIDEPIAPFSDSVPTTWRLGATHRLAPTWLLLAGLTHDDVAGSEFGFGGEWSGIGWLPLRAGLAHADIVGLRLSSGFGLALGPLRWDLSITQSGGLFNNVKGLGLGTTLSLVGG